MKNRWYDKSMPSVESIASYTKDSCNSFMRYSGIKEVRLFGSFADNIHNKNFTVKDVDILVVSNYDSGDLLAIDIDSGILGASKEELENDGYDAKSVLFTKHCRSMRDSIFDIWLVSKDKKILHMGQMPESIEDWKEVRKESEDKTEVICGFSRKDLYKKSEKDRHEWNRVYDIEMNKYVSNSPYGWYLSSSSCKEILDISIPLESI